MQKGLLIGIGAGALVAIIGIGAATSGALYNNEQEGANSANAADVKAIAEDCRIVATRETGFYPATTPAPVREDAGNKQVLKGAAVGAAVGAVAGEIIGDKPGYGAAAGAVAGAAGGQAVKADKQMSADERYALSKAQYDQQNLAYDAALETCLAG